MKNFKNGGGKFGGNRGGSRSGGKSFGDRPSFGGKPSFGGGNRGGFGGRDTNRGAGAMHPAVCDECGNACEVPFRPTGDKPIYCKNCFQNTGSESKSFERAPRRESRDNRDRSAGMHTVSFKQAPEIAEMKKALEATNYKLDRLIFAVENLLKVVTENAAEPVEKSNTKKASTKKDAAVIIDKKAPTAKKKVAAKK